MKIDLMRGDCLELMKTIPDNSIDMVLTDPPYGTTACKWDSVIPFEPMWEQLKRITKDNGAICLFGSEPFSSALRMSNIKMFKYDWIWSKNRPANINCAKIRPLKYHEIVSVFSNGKKEVYYPQKVERSQSGKKRYKSGQDNNNRVTSNFGDLNSGLKGKKDLGDYHKYDVKFKNPSSIIKVNRDNKTVHPTQKPVALLEYLVKTYTLENETILDFTMGSGSTGVAAKNLKRNFIGIEMDEYYYDIAEARINEDEEKLRELIISKKENI